MEFTQLKKGIVNSYKNYGDQKSIVINGKTYSGIELSEEVENETDMGIGLVNNLINLTIDLMKRNKV